MGDIAHALAEAQEVINAAKRRAEQLLLSVKEQQESAREAGYKEGFEAGLRDAVAHAVRLIQEQGGVRDTLAEEAAKLALTIAEAIIGEHLKQKPETVIAFAKNALAQTIVGRAAIIVIHPEDEKLISQAKQELKRIAGGAEINIETDPSLARGGCIVRTDFGEVDARIEGLLESIKRKLGLQHGN